MKHPLTEFTRPELLQLRALAMARRSQGLRRGLLLGSMADVFRDVVLQALHAKQRHPDAVSSEFRCFADPTAARSTWRCRYIIASQIAGQPIRLAPEGTDFMPVRCLVVPRFGANWKDVQVVVMLGPDGPGKEPAADDIRVITAASDQQLEALAANIGLPLCRRRYELEYRRGENRSEVPKPNPPGGAACPTFHTAAKR